MNKFDIMVQYGIPENLQEFITGSDETEMRQQAEALQSLQRPTEPKKTVKMGIYGEIAESDQANWITSNQAGEDALINHGQAGVGDILEKLEANMPDKFSKLRAEMANFRNNNSANPIRSDYEQAQDRQNKEIGKKLLGDKLSVLSDNKIWK